MIQMIYPTKFHGDLTIEWEESKQAEMLAKIEALQQKGVTFHKLDTETVRKKSVLVASPITGAPTPDIRKLLIKDPDIAKVVEDGLATIGRFQGVGDIKTIGVATAAEAATQDTIAIQPAQGG